MSSGGASSSREDCPQSQSGSWISGFDGRQLCQPSHPGLWCFCHWPGWIVFLQSPSLEYPKYGACCCSRKCQHELCKCAFSCFCLLNPPWKDDKQEKVVNNISQLLLGKIFIITVGVSLDFGVTFLSLNLVCLLYLYYTIGCMIFSSQISHDGLSELIFGLSIFSFPSCCGLDLDFYWLALLIWTSFLPKAPFQEFQQPLLVNCTHFKNIFWVLKISDESRFVSCYLHSNNLRNGL